MIPYESIYNLISEYVYGGVVSGSYQDLTCIIVSTLACLFLVALPFIIVLKIIKMIMG